MSEAQGEPQAWPGLQNAWSFRPAHRDGSPDVGPPVLVDYSNYRGEVARRRILPVGVWLGSTEWHPQRGWLLHCYDWDRGDWRDYALADCNFREPNGGS